MEKVHIRFLNSTLEPNYDIFLCSASFEQRCLSVPNKVKHKKFKKVIAVENINGSSIIKKHAQELDAIFSGNITSLKVDFSDSLIVADKIAKEIHSVQGRKLNVLVDVTTFTHEVLMICLKVLCVSSKIGKITCIYVNAEEYCPEQPVNKKWLSKGCKNVHPVLGYPGMLFPSQKTHLIVIVGYEYGRAFDMISALEPNSITLAYGSPEDALTKKDHEANQVFNSLVEKMAFEYSNIESLKIPCNDPYRTSKALQDLYDSHETDNIIVVPMNNKMSTVGLVLSSIKNERVQICYAPAVLYNETNYSSPGVDCYIFQIPK